MSDALEIANRLEGVRVREHYDLIPKRIAADELRRQHAEIESLRAQLAARAPDDAAEAIGIIRGIMSFIRTHSQGVKGFEPKLAEERVNKRLDQLAAMLSAAQSQQAPETNELRSAVFKVLEGWTLPHDVRSILEIAYYSQQAPVAQGELVGWANPGAKGKTFHEIMGQAHSFCPTELPYPRKMKWMADYYEFNRPQQAGEPVTDEQIKEEWFHIHSLSISTLEKVILLARAIERLHGIKE